MKHIAIFLTALSIAGCSVQSNNDGAFKPQIDRAVELCTQNDGVFVIAKSERSAELQNCGYKCSRTTGKYQYSAMVKCNNGATFRVEFLQ